ncbi:MAG: ABC transporter permease [Actinomycetota bacterium]|nr:ABC transporter permease [Actinomycetota bacterium]
MSTEVSAPAAAPIETGADGAATVGRHHRARSPLLIIGLSLVGLMVVVALFAPLLTSYDPRAITGRALETPTGRHWLGTDVPGRDIFAQLVYGTRASLIAAVVAGSLAMLGAILIGVLPAMLNRTADAVANRVVVFLLALPGLPLLVVIGALAGNNQMVLILVIAFVGAAPNARILRSQALALRDRGFIGAARGFGGGSGYVLRRHVVPAMGPLVLIGFVYWASVAVGLQAGLAFLGLGDPSGVSWGQMLNRALTQQGIYFSPMWTWWVLPPGLAITLTLLGFTFIGVALEPSFNPRWRRSS